jgi:hypothetical protein
MLKKTGFYHKNAGKLGEKVIKGPTPASFFLTTGQNYCYFAKICEIMIKTVVNYSIYAGNDP